MTEKTEQGTKHLKHGQPEAPKLKAIHYAKSLRVVLKRMKEDGIDCGIDAVEGGIALVIYGVTIDDDDKMVEVPS